MTNDRRIYFPPQAKNAASFHLFLASKTRLKNGRKYSHMPLWAKFSDWLKVIDKYGTFSFWIFCDNAKNKAVCSLIF